MLKGINIGHFDRLITFYGRVESVSTLTNERTAVYQEGLTLWAKKELKRADERYESDQQKHLDMVTFYVRYDSTIDTIQSDGIIKYKNKYYDITGYQDDERRGFIRFDAIRRDGKTYEFGTGGGNDSYPYTFPFTYIT
jgi:SPP1 family predicted phage head-tail adaptor